MLSRFGHVGTCRPGDTFRNRIELAFSGVRRPRRAGVCGTQGLGAESIVLADQFVCGLFSPQKARKIYADDAEARRASAPSANTSAPSAVKS